MRVEFEGPELGQEELYSLMRPYGAIYNIVPQPGSDKNTPRYAQVIYKSTSSAAAARNALHAAVVPNAHPSTVPGPPTALRILYAERESQYAKFKAFASNHPRFALPLLIAVLGTLSALVLDPFRELAIKTHVKGTFDADKWAIIRWLKVETLGRLGLSNQREAASNLSGVERERAEAKEMLEGWLKDAPNSFITLTGPAGCGKNALVDDVVGKREHVLVVDCARLAKNGKTDQKLVSVGLVLTDT